MKFKIVLTIFGEAVPFRGMENKRYCSKRSADKDLKKIEHAHAPYVEPDLIHFSVEKE